MADMDASRLDAPWDFQSHKDGLWSRLLSSSTLGIDAKRLAFTDHLSDDPNIDVLNVGGTSIYLVLSGLGTEDDDDALLKMTSVLMTQGSYVLAFSNDRFRFALNDRRNLLDDMRCGALGLQVKMGKGCILSVNSVPDEQAVPRK